MSIAPRNRKTAEQKLQDYFNKNAGKVISRTEMTIGQNAETLRLASAEFRSFQKDVVEPAVQQAMKPEEILIKTYQRLQEKPDFDGTLEVYTDDAGEIYMSLRMMKQLTETIKPVSEALKKFAPAGFGEKSAEITLSVLSKLEDHAPAVKSGKLKPVL